MFLDWDEIHLHRNCQALSFARSLGGFLYYLIFQQIGQRTGLWSGMLMRVATSASLGGGD